jgi:CHAD domain-containing protein
MAATHRDKWVLDVSPDDRISDVAVRTLQTRLEAVQHYLPLAAEKPEQDVEHVHELRVWTRRASAALALYVDLLPCRRAAWMKKQLKRLRRAASEARDCDVLARRLESAPFDPEAERWLEKIREERDAAQKPIVAIHKRLKRNHRFDRRIGQLLRRVRPRGKNQPGGEEPRFGAWARARLRPIIESFFNAAPADASDVSALHRFRIRGKKLRYAMELLAGAFPPEFLEELYPVVETLQEKLGDLNDLATARTRLRRRIEEADGREEATRLRHLLAEERARLETARREFLTWCTPALRQELRTGFESQLGRPRRGG